MKSQRNHSRHSRVSLLAALGVSALLCLPAAWAKDTEDGASAEDWLESLEPGARVNALVSYKEGNLAEILAHVEALDGDTGTLLKDRRLVSVNAKAEALMELLRSGLVLSMEHDVARFMYGSGQDYHRTLVQAQQLPFAGMTIPDEFADTLTVCIIDSGLDIHHPDLALTRVTGESAPDKGLLVPQTVGDWFVDEIGHGTHVAGIVAALDNNIGATGIAPNDRIALHIVKVF
ncbi:MAG: S8 family serine peptidase, partial [Pseudomonadota bacterium]